MKNKIVSAALALTLLFALAVPAALPASAGEIEDEVYAFLTEDLGLNSAAAVAIMANIMCESSFNLTAGGIDTNDLYSYGLVMWNGPRFERLKNWCAENGLAYDTAEGQLGYLRYELENGERATLDAMRAIPDTFEGAVEATVLFAELFERCASFSYGLRVYYTTNFFWPDYGSGVPSERQGINCVYCNFPLTVREGESFTLRGAIVSYTSPMTEIEIGIYDPSGALVSGTTVYPDSYGYDISFADRYVKFNVCGAGTFYYRISAVNADGRYVIEEHEFTVGDVKTVGQYSRFTEGVTVCGYGRACPGAKFTDMPPVGSWAHEGIDYAIYNGLFVGVSKTKFGPDDPMTRAMLVTVLWRIEGKPVLEDDGAEALFEDVDPSIWYADAVAWARSQGIVMGITEDYFDPESIVTREQTATIMHRYAVSKGLDFGVRTDISGFTDYEDVSFWADDSLSWAVNTGLLNGTKVYGVTMLDPLGQATRAQVATILMRFIEDIMV